MPHPPSSRAESKASPRIRSEKQPTNMFGFLARRAFEAICGGSRYRIRVHHSRGELEVSMAHRLRRPSRAARRRSAGGEYDRRGASSVAEPAGAPADSKSAALAPAPCAAWEGFGLLETVGRLIHHLQIRRVVLFSSWTVAANPIRLGAERAGHSAPSLPRVSESSWQLDGQV